MHRRKDDDDPAGSIRDYGHGQILNWTTHPNDIAQGRHPKRQGNGGARRPAEYPPPGPWGRLLQFEFTCTYAKACD